MIAPFFPCTLALLAQGGAFDSYLPVTGPVPLRFEIAMARSYVFPRPQPAPPAVKNEEAQPAPAAASGAAASAATRPVATFSETATAQTVTNLSPETPAATSPESAIPEIIAPLKRKASAAASDMLLVTPEMLAEFLKPRQFQTNNAGATVIVPAPVNFIAPVENDAPSSRATYKTE